MSENTTADVQTSAAPEPQPVPDTHEIAGIIEQEGFVPRWVVWAIIIALFLATVCWVNVYGY